MKNLFLTLVFVFLTQMGFSQHVSFSNDKQNVAYVGIPNPLTIVAENINCKSLQVRTSSGTITKMDDCYYYLELTEQGTITLEAVVKRNGKYKVIGVMNFRGKRLPNPTARVGSRREHNSMSKGEFKAQIGMVAVLEGFDLEARFNVTGFYMSVIRNNKVIFGHANKGSRFDDTINYFEVELTSGDRIVFSDIRAKGPDKTERHLTPIELTIE